VAEEFLTCYQLGRGGRKEEEGRGGEDRRGEREERRKRGRKRAFTVCL
jgi:hypothetical protein